MGGCQSFPNKLEEDSEESREHKILLLGTSQSGKSTIFKQIKIIHQNGYTRDELIGYRLVVYSNLIESAQAIVRQMRRMGVVPNEPANRSHADHIIDYPVPSATGNQEFILSEDIAQAIHSLWQDPIIATVMDRSSDFYLMDSASYFFSAAARIGQPTYVPTEMDVLRAQQQTKDMVETRFKMGRLSISMFDFGGVRSERKKWIHCFESTTSIIFCAALSDYDQVLLEDNSCNRMTESLMLFETVINNRCFLRTSIILFLTKIDIFKRKLPKVPLETYFEEYIGGPDINQAAKYILWRFMQKNRARLSVYPHLTQTTDTGVLRLVSAAVKETIFQNAKRDSGIL